MYQLIWTYTCLLVLPALLGAVVRFFCRRLKRAWLVTAAFFALMIGAWVAAKVIPSHGSELYGLRALQATAAAVGSLVTGAVICLCNRQKEKN